MGPRHRSTRPLLAAAAAALLGVLPNAAAAQQTGGITGTVVESGSGRPLAGAQVFIPNTSHGTITTSAGRYLLTNVPAGAATVRVQMIGYSTTERSVTVVAGQSAVTNFELATSAIALDEVVVTGAGVATTKKKLGNTVATIDAAALEQAPVISFSEVIQGREPGVVGLPSGGLTGEGTRIRIRGTNSLAMTNEPIVYLNGVRIDNGGGWGLGTGGGGQPSRLDDIDPSSIERIEILKGAAAATLYGSEASGGVIQIFTKTGARSGEQTRWDFQVEQGFLEYPDVIKPNAGFARTQAQADRINAFWGTNVQPYEVFEVDFTPRLFETGYTSNYTASVSGGTGVVAYFASGRYGYEDGPVGAEDIAGASDQNKRVQGTVSISVFPLENLDLRLTSMYTDVNFQTVGNNNYIYAPFTLAAFLKPELATCYGDATPNGDGTCSGRYNPGNAAFGTVKETLQQVFEQEAQHYNGSLSAAYRPAQGLNLNAIFGIDLTREHNYRMFPFGWNLDGFTTNNVDGERVLVDRATRQVSMDVRAALERNLTDDISSQTVFGTQGFIKTHQDQTGAVRDFPGPGFGVLSAGAVQATSEFFEQIVNAGVLGQQQFGWRDWLFMTVGARYDWNSAFGENAGGAFYPKASISVVPSDRGSWSSDLLSTFRVRAAIGQSGLQPGAFDKYTTYQAIRAEGDIPGVRPANLGNPDLKPEVATEWEVGAEFGLLNDRLAVDVTYWDRVVEDALVSRQFPVTGGFTNRQLVNLGQLDANGWEISVNGAAYQGHGISVDLFANAAYLEQIVTDMGGSPALKVGESYTRYRNWIKEGYAPGAFFGPELDLSAQYPIDISPRDCQPDTEAQLLAYFASPREANTTAIRPLVMDCTGDFLGRYIGKPDPDWQGGFGGSLTWGPLRVNTLFEYKWGDFYVHNLTDGFRRAHPALGGNLRGKSEVEAVLVNPSSTAQQRLEAANEYVRRWAALAPFDGLNEIERADFIRWRELGVTYTVPTDWIDGLGARSMAVTVTGRNLGFLHNKYSGTDPEINLIGRQGARGGLTENFANGIDAFGFPLPRRFTFAARVGF